MTHKYFWNYKQIKSYERLLKEDTRSISIIIAGLSTLDGMPTTHMILKAKIWNYLWS